MENNGNQICCKVIILGQFGVGKTQFINRSSNDYFEDYERVTTLGEHIEDKIMEFKEYPEKSIKFEIYDTAGQEIYFALPKFFYRDAGAVFLVYDISNKDSFEEIKNYWYKEINEKNKRFLQNNFGKK